MSVIAPRADIRTESPTAMSSRDERFLSYVGGIGLEHQPGLDGLRGLAVAAVVALHIRPNLVPGGAAGVSLFFTLSGFLISSMILQSIQRHGGFSIAQFWQSRARRLLPATFLMIAAVSVIRVTTDAYTHTNRPDASMAVLQGYNWYQIFRDPVPGYSAFGHMWSLSIEEQFYIAVAIAMLLFVRWKISLRTLAIVAFSGAMVSFLIPLVFDLTGSRVYSGTDTRAGEILAGICLATVVFTRHDRAWLLRHRDWVAGVGLVGASGMIAAFLRTNHNSFGLDLHLFPLMSVLSVLMVLGALVPGGALHSVLCTAPLTWLGRRSYALYLYHIPVAIAIDHWSLAHTSLGRAALVLAITLPLAELSHRVIEMPVRTRRFHGPPLAAACAVVLTVIAVCAFFE